MLVGREKELHLLHDIQNDDSSHFVAVYGRRRVGKTILESYEKALSEPDETV